jgi:hypothetical protein
VESGHFAPGTCKFTFFLDRPNTGPPPPSRAQEIQLGVARRRFVELAALWVLLATICAHALSPGSSSFTRSSGSAFSYHTVEVSLGPKGASSVVKTDTYNEQQSGTPPEMAVAAFPSRGSFPPRPVDQQQLRRPVSSPPSESPGHRPYAARAPPAALIQA